MSLEKYFPVWDQLTSQQQQLLRESAMHRAVSKGTTLYRGSSDCVGLLVVQSGQLRAYILSDTGKEVTVYRLFERDICLFSASCVLSGIQFDIMIEAEKDSELWVIPADVYKDLMAHSLPVANYTNQVMASRFSDVMWLVEQVMWKSFDARLAEFLLEESALDESSILKTTHEKIAAHLGTAREVVSRMLQYFQSEGMVSLGRGTIELTDPKRLRKLAQ